MPPQEIYGSVSKCNDCIQSMLPLDKKDEMNKMVTEAATCTYYELQLYIVYVVLALLCTLQVKELEKRLEVLDKTEQKLSVVEDFNVRLRDFDSGVSEMEEYLLDARHQIDELVTPSADVGSFSPEDRITRYTSIVVVGKLRPCTRQRATTTSSSSAGPWRSRRTWPGSPRC